MATLTFPHDLSCAEKKTQKQSDEELFFFFCAPGKSHDTTSSLRIGGRGHRNGRRGQKPKEAYQWPAKPLSLLPFALYRRGHAHQRSFVVHIVEGGEGWASNQKKFTNQDKNKECLTLRIRPTPLLS